ncbi:MAG: hypothetical protein H0Z39_06275 [Peptococcaceae bacterium]|nr:hypothetical protein [Peptococcaceae bacterium]
MPGSEQRSRSSSKGNRDHVHVVEGIVAYASGGSHTYAGLTGPPVPRGDSHIHRLKGFTDIHKDHLHQLEGETGLAIFEQDRRHYHVYKGKTSIKIIKDHYHVLEGTTGPDRPKA